MKKNLLLVLTLISMNSIFAQVALDQVVGDLYKTIVFANGTDSFSIVGNNNRNSASSDVRGGTNGVFLPSSTTAISFTSTVTIPSTINTNEVVGITNINWDTSTIYEDTMTTMTNSNGLIITFKRKWALADTNSDGQHDAHLTTYEMISDPIANPIPIGTIIGFKSPVMTNAIGGGTLLSNKSQFKIWNGTEWIETTTTPSGATNLGIAPWVSSPLSIIDYKNNENISLFPNPTSNFLTIKNEENSTESFEFKIVDLTGRIVKNGNSIFNEQINIESLESGNYIIQIETESGEKLTEKLIKN